MEILKTWLKRTGALATAAIFVQWLVLPDCPCQLRAMFAPVALSTAGMEGGKESAPGPKADNDHGPREFCSCSDGAAKTLHVSSPDITAPTMLAVAAPGLQMAAARHPALSGDRLNASGTDPPGGCTRLHLRLQVFLV